MAFIESVNSKANVKQFTNNDLPFNNGQPIINSYYATSTAGQTVINLTFSINTTSTGYTDNFWLFVDGKKLDLGSSNDFTFTSVNADGTSSQVTLTQSLPAGLNIQAFKLGLKPEIQFGMDNRFTQLYEYLGDNFQGCINPNEFTLTATSSAGTPPAGQFYSSINNRASLIDLSQDLKPRFGIERIEVQQLQPVQNESGPNGEVVWSASNDLFGQIRFVGNWTQGVGTSGTQIISNSTNDFVEVTFYGTGLNALFNPGASVSDYRYSVDGGSESAISWPASPSNVLQSRSYSANVLYSVVSGLTLGIHTVKIRNNNGAAGQYQSGFEILNQNATPSNISVNSGVGYYKGQKYVSSSQSLFSYSSVVTGTRGGRVLVYQNSDGSIGKAFQAVNASQQTFSSADHTNEEVVRTYHFREFGAGRSDDFSTLTSSASANRAFTLEDGTTTLVAANIFVNATTPEALMVQNLANALATFTFVGTGLDIIHIDQNAGSLVSYNVLIDGTNVGTFPGVASTVPVLQKIVSGLPYGTHTVSIQRSASGAADLGIIKYVVYQPKKPSLPSGAIELADYNVLANYVAAGSAGFTTISTGVLRKAGIREFIYNGTWTAVQAATLTAGYQIQSSTSGSYYQYSFFGTGVDIRFATPSSAASWSVTVDGASNLTGFTTTLLQNGTGVTWTPSTGTVGGTSSISSGGNSLQISGMTLGWHTIKVSYVSGSNTYAESFDIITPIYSDKSNLYSDFQNSLPVGSNAISDNRKFTPIKDVSAQTKNFAQAIGIVSSPTFTGLGAGVYVPVTDMFVAHKNTSGLIQISVAGECIPSGGSSAPSFQLWIDGLQVPNSSTMSIGNGGGPATRIGFSQTVIVSVSPGVHIIQLVWAAGSGGGTQTMAETDRNLSVLEL